nr:MAG TPA: hypothetical protein [Caudoviricetes sp.]
MSNKYDIFRKYENMLDAFISKLDSNVKNSLISEVNYDIDKIKDRFIDYIKSNNIGDIYKYNFILDNMEFNPMCDIIRIVKLEDDKTVNRICNTLNNFNKYTGNIAKDFYSSKNIQGPMVERIQMLLVDESDKNKYEELDYDVAWYLEVLCKWRLEDVLWINTTFKYRHLFKLIHTMCAKCSYNKLRKELKDGIKV